MGIVEKAGAWYKYEGKNYQGRNGIVNAAKEDETLMEQIKKDINTVLTGEVSE